MTQKKQPFVDLCQTWKCPAKFCNHENPVSAKECSVCCSAPSDLEDAETSLPKGKPFCIFRFYVMISSSDVGSDTETDQKHVDEDDGPKKQQKKPSIKSETEIAIISPGNPIM